MGRGDAGLDHARARRGMSDVYLALAEHDVRDQCSDSSGNAQDGYRGYPTHNDQFPVLQAI
jgi:hypothetical protein